MATSITPNAFLAAVKAVYQMAHNNGYIYHDSQTLPPCADKRISCDRLISRALWDLGYQSQPKGGYTINNGMETWLVGLGFKKTTDKKQIKPGAVISVGQSGTKTSHVFVINTYNTSTDICSKYDTGSNERIKASQPFNNVKLNEWPNRHFITAYNCPEAKSVPTSSTAAQVKNYLSKGDTGETVKTLQSNLNYLYNSGLTVDGSFGDKTLAAVKAFQKAAGLTVDGLYGKESQAKLEELVKKQKETQALIEKKKQAELAKNTVAKTDFNSYYAQISNSGSDERGQYSGGQAGDQTKNEWSIRTWYNRPWNVVLRYPDKEIGKLIAELAIEAANNDNIGYDQNQRGTYWQQLSKVGYRPSKITTPCEADCSSGVAANVKAVGYLKGLTKLQNVSADAYTGNLKNALVNAGFKALTDSKYLTGYNYLLPGDILLYEGHHVATNLGIGKYAEKTGVGINATSVKTTDIQKMLNDCGWNLKVDGDYGKATTEAVKEFQKIYKLDVDGNVGSKTIKVLQQVSKIANSGFDAEFYANKYNDIKKVYGTEKKNLLSHYYFYGKTENRDYKRPVYSTAAVASSVTGTSEKSGTTAPATPKTSGRVTTLLNVRQGPGIEYPNIAGRPTIPANTIVGICDIIMNKKNQKWYYIQIPGSTPVMGYVKSDFVKV